MKSERGVSSVVGYVLIVGITVISSGLMIYAGMSMVDVVSDRNEDTHAQQSMSQFSSEAGLVALGNLGSREIDYGSTREGHIELREDASTIEVYAESESGTTHLLDERSLGAVVYENGDTEIAYEGGGVWRKEGAYSEMVSPPEYHYQGRTLTFPVIRIVGGDESGGSTRLAVERADTSEGIDYENPIDGGEVYVTVESDYCEGWRQFFLERTGGSVSECDDGEVTTELVVPREDSLEHGIAVTGSVDSGNGNGNGGVTIPSEDYIDEEAELVDITPAIEAKVESVQEDDVESGCLDEAGTCTLTNGTYFVNESVTLDGSIDFDTSDGPIDIVVNGDLDVGGQTLMNVDQETDNGVEYYVNGNFNFQNPTIKTENDSIEASRNIFYVADGAGYESQGQGNAAMDIVLYAPNADISLHGNPEVRGAISANTLTLQGSTTVEYDEELAEFTVEPGTTATAITYLHLSENEITVDIE